MRGGGRRRGATQEQSLRERAFGGAVWGTVQTLVMLPVNFVGNLLVARFLGPGDLGAFVALMVFLSISTPLLDFGFSAALQQWSGRAVAAGDRAGAERLFRKALGFHLLVQQPGVLVAAAFILRDSPGYYFWSFALISIIGSSLGSINYWLAANHQLAMGARRAIVSGIVGNVALVTVAWAGGSPELMWLARSAVGLLPAMAILFALTGPDRRMLLKPQLPLRMPSGFWTFARPMWLTTLLGAVLATRCEVYLLRWNDAAVQAGVFAVAFGLATQVTSLFSGIHSSFGAVAVTLSGGPEAPLARALSRGHDLFAVLAAATVAAAAGLPHLVVPLYGPAYQGAAAVMLPLLVASTLQLSLTAFGASAVVRLQRRRLLATQALAVVLDLGLAALLVPLIGLRGAVVGASAGLVVVSLALLVWEVGLPRAASLLVRGPWLTGCLAMFAGTLLGSEMPGHLVPAVVASGSAMGFLLLMLRFFHQDALRTVLELMDGRIPARVHSALAALLLRDLPLTDPLH